jgi:hypothetical protein
MSQVPNTPEQAVRVAQIITGALVMGVVLFAVVALLFVGALDDSADGVILSGMGAAFAVVAFVMHLVIPAQIARQQTRTTEESQLYGVYVTKTIIGLALLEGAAFFNLVALIVEHNWWSLAIVGGLVFWMLAMWPTRTRVDHWVETQQMLNQTDG